MRCLSLADVLRDNKCDVSFICRELPGNLCQIVREKGFKIYHLPHNESKYIDYFGQPPHASWLGVSWESDAGETTQVLQNVEQPVDWLITDHYALDYKWEGNVRSYVRRVMVIDDLADRRHDCDLILDQNLYKDAENRYIGLVPESCTRLLGPKYALLRSEFVDARKKSKQRDGTIGRILIFFGSSDMTGETLRALEAVKSINRPDIGVDVVVGLNNPNQHIIKTLIETMPQVKYHSYVNNMAELMLAADVCIGAAGTTTWERCCLGLPALVITVAQNQIEAIRYLAKYNVLYLLGESGEVSKQNIKEVLEYFIENPSLLSEYSYNAMKLVDGLGTKRCLHNILNN